MSWAVWMETVVRSLRMYRVVVGFGTGVVMGLDGGELEFQVSGFQGEFGVASVVLVACLDGLEGGVMVVVEDLTGGAVSGVDFGCWGEGVDERVEPVGPSVVVAWGFGVGGLEEVFGQAGGCAGPFEHLPDVVFGGAVGVHSVSFLQLGDEVGR